MISKYESFLILEKLNELEFLLEGSLEFSDMFYDKLFDLSKKSSLAKQLYLMRGKYYEDDKVLKNNYIDVTDKDDKVSFISQVKFDQLLSRSDDPNIDPYSVKGRTEIAIGRCIRSILDMSKISFNDKELEEFVDLYKSKTASKDEQFKLVEGEDIKYWYDFNNYFQGYGGGSLSNSCMKSVNNKLFEIYSNSDCCQLLILTNMDGKNVKLIGRALVWKPKKIQLKDKKDFKKADFFMDRIYCMKDSDNKKFEEYADKMGWLRKKENNSDNHDGLEFLLGDQTYNLHITCRVEGDCDSYPYLDTLKFLDKTKRLLSNIGFKDGYNLESVSGYRGTCDDCDGSGKMVCDECNEGVLDCNECSGNGEIPCIDCGCDECSGRGTISKMRDRWSMTKGWYDQIECKDCDGKCRLKEKCKTCKNTGKTKCHECNGEGEVKCDKCEGKKLKCPECVGLINEL